MKRLKAQFKPGTKLMFSTGKGSETCTADVDWTVDTYLSLSKGAQRIAAEVAQACAMKLPGGCSEVNYLCEMFMLLKKAEADGMLPRAK
ncbi:hypothetical protein [Pseudomonas fluorescens]|uniref:Uncharacterized protein n=1 Tax=Pseudomonas fluorescens TaxID=294 RepID=A0A5E7F399_PSEFL|nr:hypothetical protein [Pseudomonas fluorescens]VVO32143.1 hypothetical protein PS691_05028 [Pseudomonas fluorescens]